MRSLNEQNCAEYLRDVDLIGDDEDVSVQVLAGGVSNVVFYVERRQGRGGDFVLKQARGQLRVEQPWFCNVERIWREVDVLQICAAVLHTDAFENKPTNVEADADRPPTRSTVMVPAVLFEDRDNYAFAMMAAPKNHRTWKSDLLARVFSREIAVACGVLLGRLHAGTWNNEALVQQIGDRQYFHELRVDPYYRRVAQSHPDLQPRIDRLIDSLAAHPRCLVHGDFSPKNLLVWDDPSPGLMLIDCEVGHFGDPAFDLGFFLSHLILKGVLHRRSRESTPSDREACRRPVDSLSLCESFWSAYRDILQSKISSRELNVLQQRAIQNLAGCLLARVDGKSPVEYLSDDNQKETVRKLARRMFEQPPDAIQQSLEGIRHALTPLRSGK